MIVPRTLIGRESELGELERSLLPLLGDGSAVRVVLAAEPGFGKTTLLGELIGRAQSQGAAVLSGRASPVGGSTLTYGPVATALARHLDRLGPAERTTVTDGLPSLGRLLEGLTQTDETAGDTDTERMRLYQSIALLLGRLAAEQPLLLAVDDLHWADPATIELLSFLQAEVSSLPIGLVVAYRPGDIADRPEIGVLVGDLLRGPTACRVELDRLSDEAVGELMCVELGGLAAPMLSDLVVSRSRGNPLAVESMVRELRARDALVETPRGWEPSGVEVSLPDYVQDLFGDRIERLSAEQRRVLLALACSHRPATVAELAEVGGIEQGTVADTLSALQRLRLVVTGADAMGAEVYEPAHPLIAEAAQRGASANERSGIHASWARRLVDGGAQPEETAIQILVAGDGIEASEAIDVLSIAGRHALDEGAADAAARWLGAAAVRAREAGVPASQLGEILVGLLDAWERRGEVAAAERVGNEATELLTATDPRKASSTAARVAVLAWLRGDLGEADRVSRLSVDLAARGTSEDGVRAAAERCFMPGRMGGVEPLSAAAVDLETAISSAGFSIDGQLARFSVGMYMAASGGSSIATALGALPSDWEQGDPSLRNHAFGVALEGCLMLGDWEAVRALLRSQAVPHLGVRGWRSLAARHDLAWSTGDWDEASDIISDASFALFSRQARRAQLCRAFQAAHRGDVDGARSALAAADEIGRDDALLSDEALVPDVALASLGWGGSARLVDGSRFDGTWPSMWYPATAAAHGEYLVASGEFAEALALAARLSKMGAGETRLAAIGRRIEGLATAPTSSGAGRELLWEASERFDALGMPFEAARCAVEACEAAHAAGDAALLSGARDRLESLGAEPWAARARAICGSGATRRAAALTRREREVALLVADGLTNAAIAERLVLSIRTVTSHLDHAYTKLGIGSRAALTAYVLRHPEVT